jgi:hypothetical protein
MLGLSVPTPAFGASRFSASEVISGLLRGRLSKGKSM